MDTSTSCQCWLTHTCPWVSYRWHWIIFHFVQNKICFVYLICCAIFAEFRLFFVFQLEFCVLLTNQMMDGQWKYDAHCNLYEVMDIVVDSWFFIQAEHRTMAVFILAVIVNNYNTGQVKILNRNKNRWRSRWWVWQRIGTYYLSVWLTSNGSSHTFLKIKTKGKLSLQDCITELMCSHSATRFLVIVLS